jgi:hypothetical protein
MSRPIWGAVIFPVLLLGCAAPMTLADAKHTADREVTRFCRQKGDCGKLLQTRAQRVKDRWLVDYDSNGRVLTVAVDDDGNARLDIWNKK